jgi:kinesin family protein 2/24
MTGIEARAAGGLFRNNIDGTTPVTIQFVELCGSKECKDLLSPSSSDVKIRDNEDGSVQMTSTSMEISSPDELLHAIQLAKSRRATESTDKNGVSSRSHAVCQIQMKSSGVLTLIDCAGSERRHDSMYHDSQRQKETAEINTSLWALKECIRARANNRRIPYRSSTLTRILRQSLEREDANLCVIGCIAPNGTDTEHTMETLKTISTIVGIDDKIVEEKTRLCNNSEVSVKTLKVPKQWTNAELQSFVSKKMGDIKLPSKYDGSAVMKMSVSQMKAQLSIDGNEADQLFNLLRKENDRTSKVQRQERIRAAKNRQGRI